MITVLSADRLSFRYAGAERDAIADVSLDVASGTLCALLGPNGSGKSTLMRLLLGALQPRAGTVTFEGQPLARWPRRELARGIGVVAQQEESAFPMTVRELVAMGRYPHLGPWRREATADRAAIARALERCEVADLAHRPIATLSGGELQRVRIARALAQEPRTLVLDEPTAALDIAHEMAIFELLGALAVRDRVTILIVTHNINLAARYADALLLLDRGAAVAHGPPAHVLERTRLEAVYGWPLRVHPYAGPGRDAGAPQVVPVSLHRADEPKTHRSSHSEPS